MKTVRELYTVKTQPTVSHSLSQFS